MTSTKNPTGGDSATQGREGVEGTTQSTGILDKGIDILQKRFLGEGSQGEEPVTKEPNPTEFSDEQVAEFIREQNRSDAAQVAEASK